MALTKSDGSRALSLVLEPGNLHRLQQGDPIKLCVHELFPDGIPRKLDLLISFSETPIADARELAKHAEVAFDDRSRVTKKPHCPECRSTIEQLGVWKNESPVALTFCPSCGCVFGALDSVAFKQAE